ncbi:MAG TPA: transposase [Planctomycetota bacterium]|nr:transposase [Planctomycetota bacterium]
MKKTLRRALYRTLVASSCGYLPHLDPPGAIQFVTFHLVDAGKPNPRRSGADEDVDVRRWFAGYESELHTGRGACILRLTSCATAIADALLRYEPDRYDLLAWVVMPNHVHVMVRLARGVRLSAVVHGWKRASATAINRALRRNGPVWFPEHFDRVVRAADDADAIRGYIEMNPVRAGLVATPGDWPYSSIRGRIAGR